jgi:transcriptional regulator with XRE-family HTH domain
MEEFGSEAGIGRRIRTIRRARGIKSTAELAARMPGTNISGAVLRNIEAGVKTDLTVSELLNISRALNVAPIFLLAPIREPDAAIDLPNLSQDLKIMSALELDEWLSTASDSIQEWTTPEEQSENNQLRAMRLLNLAKRDRERLSRLIELTPNIPAASEADLEGEARTLRARVSELQREIRRLEGYLRRAGWNI